MLKKVMIMLVMALAVVSVEASAALPKKAAITNIEIEGISDADKLMKVIGLKKGDLYTPEKIQHAKTAIIKSLEAQGLYGTTVETKVKPVNDGVAITFDVNKGEEIKIKKVKFVGNKQVPASDLEDHLVNKEGTWFSWIPIIGGGGGKAVPDQLPYDQLRIREAYLERGYLDAKVAEPLMKMDFNKHEAEVTYVVHEGEQYKVADIKIQGKVPGLDTNQLMEELKLKPGKVFDVRKLRHDLKTIQEKVGDLGYAFAEVKPLFKKDPKKHTVSATYVINPHKKVKIHDVIITGNTKTLDYVIRRYVYLAPGDYFSYTDLQDTKKELQRTGFFDKVVVKPQRINDQEMDLIVEVTEAQTGSISGGIGYGSYDGFMINAGVSDRNLFGTGIAGSLNLEYGQKSHNYALSITDPRVFNTLFSFSVGVYDSRQEYDYDDTDDTQDYTVDRTGGWFSFGRKIGRHWHASLGYSYSDVDYHDYVLSDDFDTEDIKPYESYKKSSILGSVVFDNTDDYYVPREGIYSKLSLEYAGAGGDAEFWKSDLKFAAYYGMEDMIDYDLILRYKLHAGYMDDDGYTPIAEMYTLGGARDGVRGYSPGSISPRYTDSDGRKYIAGGNQIVVNSVEASIPLDMITNNMRLTGFVDYGMIRNTIYKNVDDSGWIDRASAGAQIEWRSPFGPINLVFAYPINKKSGDDTSVFEFSMGRKF
ncbi:outer membrane protein assembly factor BamA [Nitratifractor salsuginis]|uniref:Outer membrane protein assembly factor BamA n=1 Tax=Nitratifractor salsuginis (strain DSM 16511 / JCM 12458 / E9I37-1) TaxID=749222 RepID=E6WZH2_NITSE|nr:outer membrane protein assembly factor BamA [Nitratifractor salsuginis]ADV45552.1 outer membrane protein assembly complex, YaeT protein [Nitratifractor salsuginis DSM 16511]